MSALPPKPTTSISTLLSLLSTFALASGFRLKPSVDFEYCWTHIIQLLNVSDYSDSRQYFPWNPTHSYRLNTSQPRITLPFCESACGDGYQLWTWDDTMLRITMWVFPAIVLLVHFHFAPLGVGNICAIIAHLLGDPLDTMWSMMTRQEVNRRFYRRAKKYSDGSDPKHIATVWSAYDELGWRDSSSHFAETLRLRDADIPAGPNKENHRGRSIFYRGLAIVEGWMGSPSGYDNIQVREGRGPTPAELYYIQLASHRLASNRSETQLTTWFAIIGLFGALGAAFIRTYTQKLNNQTAHTIAVVALFFILIPIVKISGNMGAFSSTSVALDIIQDLHRNLRSLNPDGPQLFPPLMLVPHLNWDYSRPPPPAGDVEMEEGPTETQLGYRNLELWPRMAPWAGMNNSWRPCKRMLIEDYFSTTNRSRAYLFFLALLFLMSAYAPALVLSYKTPTVGFSCRSLAWTLVFIAWLFSAAVDQILKMRIASARSLWSMTLIKDACIVIFFVLVIITAQIGFFNNCWCRSGVLELRGDAFVGLGPQSQEDWVAGWPLWVATPVSFLIFILILIFTVGQDGDNARTLLSRSESERQYDLLILTQLRAELEGKGELPGAIPNHLDQA